MSCNNYKDMLHSYANNELMSLEANAISKHLEECSSCGKELEEIKKFKAIAAAVKIDIIQLDDLKRNIMSAIKVTRKVSNYVFDIKVLSRVGASMVACGVVAMVLNFTALGSNLEQHTGKINMGIQEIGQKITQPIGYINKGLVEVSGKFLDLNGITFRIEQKIRGGM